MDIVLFYILEIRVRQSNEFKTNKSAIGDRTVAQIDFNRYNNRVIDLPTYPLLSETRHEVHGN